MVSVLWIFMRYNHSCYCNWNTWGILWLNLCFPIWMRRLNGQMNRWYLSVRWKQLLLWKRLALILVRLPDALPMTHSPSMVLMHAICKRLSVARVRWFTVRAHLLPSECSPQRHLSESFRLSQSTRIPTWHILMKDQRSHHLMYPSGLHGWFLESLRRRLIISTHTTILLRQLKAPTRYLTTRILFRSVYWRLRIGWHVKPCLTTYWHKFRRLIWWVLIPAGTTSILKVSAKRTVLRFFLNIWI